MAKFEEALKEAGEQALSANNKLVQLADGSSLSCRDYRPQQSGCLSVTVNTQTDEGIVAETFLLAPNAWVWAGDTSLPKAAGG